MINKIKMKKIILIAEIGWNHFGDIELAKKMINSAKDSGADYAKFQTWSVERLKQGVWDKDGRREIYEKAELSEDNHIELINHCKTSKIKFLSSVFSIPDAKLLIKLGVKDVKIPSFESRNHDLISFCNNNFNKIFMSTGTSKMSEINDSLKLFTESDLYLMHCVSMYPCNYGNANLPKMKELMKIHENVGYSDHIQGPESAKIAIAEGAKVIEKHFTLDNNLPGRDNKFANLPSQFKDISDFLVNYNEMMVDHGMDYQDGEEDSRLNYKGRFDG